MRFKSCTLPVFGKLRSGCILFWTRLVVATALVFLCLEESVAAPADKPNIIYILADDLGYGDLGCYGQGQFATPNLDRLAAEGMKFTRHYAGSPVCGPSRSCLMTGQHTGHTYIRGNGPVALRPAPDDVTVFEILKNAGYQTALIGKSGLSGDTNDPGHPGTKGVDHFFGFVNHTTAHHYFPPVLCRDGKAVQYPNNNNHEGDSYSADLFLKDALTYLDNAPRPFFLHYATQLPHASLYAPEEWKKKYRGQFKETPVAGQKHYRNEPEPKATFAAMVSRLDWEVGEIMNKLREKGLDKNTLVIFASDNGPTTVAGYDPVFFQSAGQFRGFKRDLTEGGIRVPMIASWPGHIQPGSTTDLVSCFWDFLPTACDLAGIRPPTGIDGISFLPTLRGESEKQTKHDYLYWEFYEKGGMRAVLLDGRWKGIQLKLAADPIGPIGLYDLSNDTHEDHNVAANHPEIIGRMKSIFAEAHTPSDLFRWAKKEPND